MPEIRSNVDETIIPTEPSFAEPTPKKQRGYRETEESIPMVRERVDTLDSGFDMCHTFMNSTIRSGHSVSNIFFSPSKRPKQDIERFVKIKQKVLNQDGASYIDVSSFVTKEQGFDSMATLTREINPKDLEDSQSLGRPSKFEVAQPIADKPCPTEMSGLETQIEASAAPTGNMVNLENVIQLEQILFQLTETLGSQTTDVA